MAQDLTITAERPVTLNGADPGEFSHAFEVLRVGSFDDLVKHGLVESERSLDVLLRAAKTATARVPAKAKARPGAPGGGAVRRTDQERFAAFRASTAAVAPRQAAVFWAIASSLPESLVVASTTTAGSKFVEVISFPKFEFTDVTIKAGAVLTVSAKHLSCRHMLIEKTGTLRCAGSGLFISATSIQGL
jgi:hypothetical protein